MLASRSPQRRAILDQLAPAVPHRRARLRGGALPLAPAELVEAHSRGKARSVVPGPGDGPVLGVDTAVVVDGDVYGKPADEAEAAAMLRVLAGREHLVLSGLTLRHGEQERTEHAATTVTFRALDDGELAAYLASGEWRGRAGAYAIQGQGAALVERVDGCFYNVVGLPVALLLRLLREPGGE